MVVYLITAVVEGNTVYHRETPHSEGIGRMINEAISSVYSLGFNPQEAYILVETITDHDPDPRPESIIFYEEFEDYYLDEYDAEDKGRVRTISGKPHTPRKLKKDEGISPEEAARRISFQSDDWTAAWEIVDLEPYETTFGDRMAGTIVNTLTNERVDFENAPVQKDYYVEPLDNIYVDYDDWEDDEDEDDEWDMDIVEKDEELVSEAEEADANPTGGNTGDQIVSWEHNGLSSPSGPPSDIFWSEGADWTDTEKHQGNFLEDLSRRGREAYMKLSPEEKTHWKMAWKYSGRPKGQRTRFTDLLEPKITPKGWGFAADYDIRMIDDNGIRYSGEIKERGHEGKRRSFGEPFHRAEELKRDSCCCGATKSNPCACMKEGVMNCSASKPKCPCYSAKAAEGFDDDGIGPMHMAAEFHSPLDDSYNELL